MQRLVHHWYRFSWLTLCLLPLSWLFRGIVALRYFLYQHRIINIHRNALPVIVVGNITVGGTGKTPFVIWLVQWLIEQGYRPGIVTRGVGGRLYAKPHLVNVADAAADVGDEAILLARRANVPVVVCKRRVQAAKLLNATTDCDIIVADDGLQHYRLGRQIEIAMVDQARGFGNRQLLPAGPLREPVKRLHRVNRIVMHGSTSQHSDMQLVGNHLVSLAGQPQKQLADFQHQTVHAIAAIGHPHRFFEALRAAGIQCIPHVFKDHYLFQADDIRFDDQLPVLMTEKDAVKCAAFADARHWYLPVTAQVGDAVKTDLLLVLQAVVSKNSPLHP